MLRVAAQGIGCINNMLKKKTISDDEKTNSRVELNHQNTNVNLSISILLIMYFPIIENQKKIRFPKKKRHGGFLKC